jgi:hypothetical protein
MIGSKGGIGLREMPMVAGAAQAPDSPRKQPCRSIDGFAVSSYRRVSVILEK